MISGVASAAKQRAAELGRSVRIVGVQATNTASFPPSLAAGEPTTIQSLPTIADGIAVSRPGDLPFEIVREYVDEIVTVDDDEIAKALIVLLERAKLVVEPAAATGVAAIMNGRITGTGPTVVILSGGNIDPLLLLRVVRHGLASAGRYLQMRIRIADRPGGLAGLLGELAASGGNVMHLSHVRTAVDLAVDEVEVEVQVETRGPAHCTEVVARLTDAGYRVREA